MEFALQAAEALATTSHKNQKYGEYPYTKHLNDVVEVLKRFKVNDESMLAAAWLHDTIEDTDVTLSQIEMIFGNKVADLVNRVTSKPGINRAARHELTYPQIKECDDALCLKLADRIANVEFSIANSDESKIKMYTKEHKFFKEKLFKQGTHDAMWRHLDFLIGYNKYEKTRDSQ